MDGRTIEGGRGGDDNALVEALIELRRWAGEKNLTEGKFSAADLMSTINSTEIHPNPVRDAYRVFHPKIEPGDRVSPKAIGIRLKTRVGEPVQGDGETLILREKAPAGKGAIHFLVEAKADAAPRG
jgi:hypothetical protein